jgi:galactokinase
MTGIGSDGPGLEDFLAAARGSFPAILGPGPASRAFLAPGRVNLIGEHVDHSGGPSLALAVDRCTAVLGRIRGDRRLRLYGARPDEVVELHLDALPAERSGRWSDYPVGVLRALDPARTPGLDLWVGGDLAVGVGLSSSASLTVATALAVLRLSGRPVEPRVLIEAALAAERDFVGVPCGDLDPTTIVHGREGHALWLDPGGDGPEVLPLRLEGAELLVVESGVERALAGGGYARRVRECREAFEALRPHAPLAGSLAAVPLEVLEARASHLAPVLAGRARHVITETRRARESRERLARGDLPGLGELLVASHDSLRDGMQVSTPELDALVALALATPGVHGARLMGAGFGGSVLVLAEHGVAPELRRRLARADLPGEGAGRLHLLHAGGGPRELVLP